MKKLYLILFMLLIWWEPFIYKYELHYKLADSIDMIFEQGNPAGIKEIFKHLGLSENIVRLPLVNVDENLSVRLNNFIKNLA